MKLINKIWPLCALMVATISAKNEDYLKIDYLKVEESQNGVEVKTSAKIFQDCRFSVLIYLYYQSDDSPAIELVTDYKIKIKLKEEKYDYSAFIENKDLGRKNTFVFVIDFLEESFPDDEQTIVFNKGLTNKIDIIESNNNQVMTTGYERSNFNRNKVKENYTYKDEVTFINFEETHVEKIYRHYDISPIKFKYTNGRDNKLKGKFYFDFYDAFNLFPSFPQRDLTMYRRLDLEPYLDNEGYYHFRFKNKLYYQPTTNIASLEPLEGYYETNYLYFPTRSADQLNDIICVINLDISSEFNFHMSGTYSLKYEKKFFGQCYDSAYCIDQEADYGNNVKERIEDVYL